MVCDKVRIRFRKDGDLRWISHHDLMRCFDRLLRRAQIPFQVTAGFNPKPRLIFALALPLGVIGCEELADLELDQELPTEELQSRLAAASPPGLSILSVERISTKASAQVQRLRYWTPIPGREIQGLAERIQALLAASNCWVERQRPRPRRIDLRPYIHDLRLAGDILEIDLVVTPNGTARPQEILELLGLAALREAGLVIHRNVQIEEPDPNSRSPALGHITDSLYEPSTEERLSEAQD
jgi:radical SAM-linked protein